MKKQLSILFVFVCFSAFGQSKYSLNLVSKISSINWKIDTPSPFVELSEKNGIAYTLGIEGSQFINKKKTLSLGYGFLNQFSMFTTNSITNQVNGYTKTSNLKLTSLDILFPLTMKVHTGNLKIFYGFIPTYHLNTNLFEKSNWVHNTLIGNDFEQEGNFTNCNALFGNCFNFGKPKVLKDFNFQYVVGVEVQIKRFNLFIEYAQYILPQKMGHTNFDDVLIDTTFISRPAFGSFDQAFTFGTSFKIY